MRTSWNLSAKKNLQVASLSEGYYLWEGIRRQRQLLPRTQACTSNTVSNVWCVRWCRMTSHKARRTPKPDEDTVPQPIQPLSKVQWEKLLYEKPPLVMLQREMSRWWCYEYLADAAMQQELRSLRISILLVPSSTPTWPHMPSTKSTSLGSHHTQATGVTSEGYLATRHSWYTCKVRIKNDH